MPVTQLYKLTAEGLKLLPNVSTSHNVTYVPNTNLCEPAQFKFQNSKQHFIPVKCKITAHTEK